MGDYSRDPTQRLDDAVGKQYVGLRIQQGVPLLDADLNLRDDLRRRDQEAIAGWFLGDGVPVGSNGFRILPLAGAGLNTIVIDAKAATGRSTLRIDVGASTAAAALGFGAGNSVAVRDGLCPARLVGAKAQPFTLANGTTLVVSVDDGAPVTVTFKAANFADIAKATASEVSAAINGAVADAVASAGAGNDFLIRGSGHGTAGCVLVDGKLVTNSADITYSQQPLFGNAALAARWGVDVLPALSTPAGDLACIAYLDVWERELTAAEDDALVDARIGVETVAAVKREWVVRVVAEKDYPSSAAARPAGHAYYPLALLKRLAGNSPVTASMIVDLRETDLALRRQVACRGADDVMLVDSALFGNLLTDTRDSTRGLVEFITTKFLNPAAPFVAAEFLGLEALGAVAAVAEQGISMVHADLLGTGGAVNLLGQLLEAEKRFLSVWRQFVLPLNKPNAGTIYGPSFSDMINRVELYLTGPAPNGYLTLAAAVAARDLNEAVRSQAQINTELHREVGDMPIGHLNLICLGSSSATILRNTPFNIRYRVSGSVTPADALDVQAFIDPAWTVKARNPDGSIPLDVTVGPGNDEAEFLLTVTPPDVDVAATNLSLKICAKHNAGGLQYTSTASSLAINGAPPASEEVFAVKIETHSMTYVGGVYECEITKWETMTFSLTNNANSAVKVDVEYLPASQPNWEYDVPGLLVGLSLSAKQSIPLAFGFRNDTLGQKLDFHLRVKVSGTNSVLCDTLIPMSTIPKA